MPKNEQGQIVCVNHPDQVLTNETFINIPKITLHKHNNEHVTQSSTETLPAKIKFCDNCGYMEMYTLHVDDFPND